MPLNDADRTSDSKTVEDVFLQNEIGIEEKIKTNGTMTRQKVPVFKGKCHSCLEKDMIVQSQRRILKELIGKERMDQPALFCGKNNNIVTTDFATTRLKLKTGFSVQTRTPWYEHNCWNAQSA